MLDQAGTVAAANVATSKTAFDVDLGTAKDGRLVAVYSRGGKLYQYDIAAGTERSLGIRGTEPTIADGRVAYVAHKDGRDRLFLRTGGKSRLAFSAPRSPASSCRRDRLAFVTNNAPTKLLQTETLRVQTLPASRRRSRRAQRRRQHGRHRRPDVRRERQAPVLGSPQPRLGLRQPLRPLHVRDRQDRLRARQRPELQRQLHRRGERLRRRADPRRRRRLARRAAR